MNDTTAKNFLYKTIRTYNLLLSIIPSIAFYRATVQPDYTWGLLVFHGKGMSSEYWYLLLFILFSWMTFFLETWYKRKWYYALPILLFSSVTAVLLYGYLSLNEMVFQGDVWKFNFELGFTFVLISAILLFMLIVWTILDLKKFEESTLEFSRLDKIKLLSGLSISIIIFLLFAQGSGGVHTTTDGIAVGLTVIQALFLASIIDKTGNINKHEQSPNH